MENTKVSYNKNDIAMAQNARKTERLLYVTLNNGVSYYATVNEVMTRVNGEMAAQLMLQKHGHNSGYYLPCGVASVENFTVLLGKVEYHACSVSEFIDYTKLMTAMDLCELYSDVPERMEVR